MKKAVLIFSVAIVALLAIYSFSTIDKYPDYVPEDSVTMFKSHYIKTINNSDLNKQLEQNFLPLFDKVTSVDAQFSHDSGYYYIVFGEKNNTKKIVLLKIEKVDIENETYTYFDFTNIEVNEFTIFCYWPFLPTSCPECVLNPCDIPNFLCGEWNETKQLCDPY